MPILKRIPQDEIKRLFKYRALAYGIIPVYISDPCAETLLIATRNWFPEWPMNLISGMYVLFLDVIDPEGDITAPLPFLITGEIE